MRAIDATRRYAEVQLDMAEAVRRRGGRFSQQGVGVHGDGLLGRRIDHILRGDLFREISRTRKAIVAVGCAATIFIVLACRQQPKPPAPLREDPKLAEQAAQEKARSGFYQATRAMYSQQVADFEAAVKKNPEDLVSLEELLMFYAPISEDVERQPSGCGPLPPGCFQGSRLGRTGLP